MRFGRGFPPSTQILTFTFRADLARFGSAIVDGGGLVFYSALTNRNSTGLIIGGGSGIATTVPDQAINAAAMVGPQIMAQWVGPAGGLVGGSGSGESFTLGSVLGLGSLTSVTSSIRNATSKVIGGGSIVLSSPSAQAVIEEGLVLVITDKNWQRLIFSPNVISLDIDEELGSADNNAFVSISADDPAAAYIPNPDDDASEPTRFQIYSNNVLIFAGLVDKTTSRVDENGILTFGGIQRGGEMAERNFGRRDLLGWSLPETFRELLRDNIGRAPFATASATSYDLKYPPISAITGEPQKGQYWASDTVTPQSITIDLGSIQTVNAVRVIPEWTSNKWYAWTLFTSTDDIVYTQRHDNDYDHSPSGDRGVLVELSGISVRYVRVTVNESTDNIARIAGILTYQNLAEIGSATTFAAPWIENDDSGNVTLAGDTQRLVADGAFAGDGIIGHSFVTQLNFGGTATHTFRGTSNAAYFTVVDACNADFYVDNVLVQSGVGIPANSYQYKAFEVTGLSAGVHTLKVAQNAGTPRIDYFSGEYNSSYRILQEDAPMIGYTGKWNITYGDSYSGYAAKTTDVAGDQTIITFPFYGDKVIARFATVPNGGVVDWFMDGVFQGSVPVDSATPAYGVPVVNWTGAYGAHTLRMEAQIGAGRRVEFDSIEGNWAHTIYLRSATDTNLALIGRLSEMTNTFMRLNYDGTVDLLGAVPPDSGEIIREGENEGGTIEGGEVEGDWSNAVSAIIGIGKGTDDLALKVFVVDKPAVERLGIKVAKFESRDVVDAYLLVRQAWQTLQDSKNPKRNYRVSWRKE